MKSKYIFAAACAAALSLSSVFAGGEGWTHDFAGAKKEAAEGKKDLLMDFTGSDWCGWCIKLNDEVFKHDAFKTGVKDKFVLVELDYPRDQSKISDETKKQNAELKDTYAIQGYPTILLCDAEGKPYAKTGYQPGGPEKYVEHLDELRKNRETRDEAFTKAEAASGVEQAKLYVSALDALGLEPGVINTSYADIVAKIKAADPKDETGFIKKQEAIARFEELEGSLRGKSQEEVAAAIDGALKEEWPAENKQQLLGIKASLLLQDKKVDEALTILDQAIEVDADSKMGNMLKGFKERVIANKEQILKGE